MLTDAERYVLTMILDQKCSILEFLDELCDWTFVFAMVSAAKIAALELSTIAVSAPHVSVGLRGVASYKAVSCLLPVPLFCSAVGRSSSGNFRLSWGFNAGLKTLGSHCFSVTSK